MEHKAAGNQAESQSLTGLRCQEMKFGRARIAGN